MISDDLLDELLFDVNNSIESGVAGAAGDEDDLEFDDMLSSQSVSYTHLRAHET